MQVRFPRFRMPPAPQALFVAGSTALAFSLAYPALATTPSSTPIYVNVTTSPNPYAIKGMTNVPEAIAVYGYGALASGSTMSVTGVEGVVTSPFGTGVIGKSLSTAGAPGMGLYGYSANGIGIYGASVLAKYPSIFGVSTAAGGTALYGTAVTDGVVGKALKGSGVYGVFSPSPAPSGSATTAPGSYGGVYGVDASSGYTNSFGVSGRSTNATGVIGTSANGTGISANSTNGIALDAETSAVTTTSAVGAAAFYDYGTKPGGGALGNFGIYASSAAGTAVFGVSNAGPYGVEGEAAADDQPGVEGHSYGSGGIGVQGDATNPGGIGILAMAGSQENQAGDTALEIKVEGIPGTPIAAYYNSTPIMTLDDSGNLTIAGTLSQGSSGATNTSIAHDRAGTGRVMYASQQTQSTIEDVGEGQMVGGRGYVALDPAFASLVSTNSPYMVFVTPEGPNAGYYVTGKTLRGFEVRETSGRGTMAFDYRIVARPQASESRPRLAIAHDDTGGFGALKPSSRNNVNLDRTRLPIGVLQKGLRAPARPARVAPGGGVALPETFAPPAR